MLFGAVGAVAAMLAVLVPLLLVQGRRIGAVAATRTELRTDVAEVRRELREDLAEVRRELRDDLAEVRREVRSGDVSRGAARAGARADAGERPRQGVALRKRGRWGC